MKTNGENKQGQLKNVERVFVDRKLLESISAILGFAEKNVELKIRNT